MKKLLLFVLFLLPLLAQAQYRGLFIPDNKGGTTLASNEKRIALVVGNKNYSNGWGSLRNSVNDANTMTSALQDCGFEVMTLTNASRSQFLEAIRAFKGKIVGSSTVALFFYAGHGLEESGQNYLIPSDDASKCRNEIEDNGIKLSSIQKQLKDAGAAMSILVVDACRNQPMPFTCPSSDRSGTNSTFKEFTAKGSYIAFSTAPGKTASDGSGSNSPYTAALSKAIRQEGLKIEDVFKQVRRELDQIGQETWDNNGYSGDFYFKYKTNSNVVVNNNTNTTQDSDGDGIIDSKDSCPYEYGEVSNNGCPKKATLIVKNNDFTENHGYEIRVKLDNYAEKQLLLGYHFGEKQYIKDTVTMDSNGLFVFKGDKALDGGMYLIITLPDKQYFQVLVSKGEQHFAITTDVKLPVYKCKVKGSPDNELFYNYMKWLGKKREEAEKIKADIKQYSTNLLKIKPLQEKLDNFDKEVKDYQRNLIEKNKSTLTALILKGSLDIEVPEFKGSEKEVQNNRYFWYKEHFFDNFDFNDERLIRTPILHNRTDYYLNKLTVQHPDSLIKAVDVILRLAKKQPECYKYYLISLLNAYAKSNIVGQDALYVHIAREYYEKDECASWIEKDELDKIIKNSKDLERKQTGF